MQRLEPHHGVLGVHAGLLRGQPDARLRLRLSAHRLSQVSGELLHAGLRLHHLLRYRNNKGFRFT